MKYEFFFIATSKIICEKEKGSDFANLKEVRVILEASSNVCCEDIVDENNFATKAGSNIMTRAFVHGIMANIAYSHERGWKDQSVHMREVIDELQQSFIAVTQAVRRNF